MKKTSNNVWNQNAYEYQFLLLTNELFFFKQYNQINSQSLLTTSSPRTIIWQNYRKETWNAIFKLVQNNISNIDNETYKKSN